MKFDGRKKRFFDLCLGPQVEPIEKQDRSYRYFQRMKSVREVVRGTRMAGIESGTRSARRSTAGGDLVCLCRAQSLACTQVWR
jgi:hypothetical protein